ncbi:hypothetical protein SO802_033459 [Lithocarpus litseifolius]|uniref:GHMP kinase N-terminal domain-containing protein n=1 Tax=Lithocarpus litseifolius TaxID=425828 RepID=A0AAW2BD82_9ROSI
MPIREACHVAVQMNHPSKHRLWKHAWLGSKPKDKGRHLFWKLYVSYGSELSNRGPTFDMDLSDFMDGDQPISYEKQRNTLLKIHPNRRWAAFVAGMILVLMTELGVCFEDSISMLVSSAVPEGKGVLSSTSVDVASMAAIAAARGNFIYQIFQNLRTVENHIFGAPYGVMDQMTSACGEANKLLAMVCQPAEIVGLVEIPSHIRFWGIDSGIRHRVGTYMGRKMIKSTASSILSRSLINGDGLILDKLENVGVELLEDEASLDYLCNLSPHRYEALYAKVLLESMLGETFLEKYADHHDPVTVIDPKCTYGVRAPAKHPIYENFHVKCHFSYSVCGLGSDGTDRLVQLVQEIQHGKLSKSNEGTIYGAEITGGGSGGTVCVVGRNSVRSSEQILEIQQRYKKAPGYLPLLFEGSSPASGKFGYLKIHRIPNKPN